MKFSALCCLKYYTTNFNILDTKTQVPRQLKNFCKKTREVSQIPPWWRPSSIGYDLFRASIHRVTDQWQSSTQRSYTAKHHNIMSSNFYLSEGSLPGISTKRSWSHKICKNVSLQSCSTDWHTPENLSRYKDTYKTTVIVELIVKP